MTTVATEAIRRATALGHDPQPDRPDDPSPRRWTCARCQRAVIVVGLVMYGTALRQTCDEAA